MVFENAILALVGLIVKDLYSIIIAALSSSDSDIDQETFFAFLLVVPRLSPVHQLLVTILPQLILKNAMTCSLAFFS